MKRLFLPFGFPGWVAAVLAACCLVSCVEEFHDTPTGYEEEMLVVEGQIVSNRDCWFTLWHTIDIAQPTWEAYDAFVDDAEVWVSGEDGTLFPAYGEGRGRYVAHVGTLSSDVRYSLHVESPEYGSYRSRPSYPLDAPDVKELTFDYDSVSGNVSFLISTLDPQQRTYYLWEYDEHWEILTPMKALFEYLPETDEIVPVGQYTNHGWSKSLNNERLFLSNRDYGDGAITRHRLYRHFHYDNRFETCYLTQVRQMVISEEEYEYRNRLKTMNNGMGGLFTPMPSLLPTNIEAMDGDKRALGFVGVRGKVGEAELYVTSGQVEYRLTRPVREVPDSLVLEPRIMYANGYRLSFFDPFMPGGMCTWVERWVVDCTDGYWKASLEKPACWKKR